MIYAFWIDIVMLTVWLLLYCAEEVHLAGKRWDFGCFRRWRIVNAAKDRAVYGGEMKNYLVQSVHAAEQGHQRAQALKDAGWIETGADVLTSPDGKSTVML